ncbi:MAG: UDP-N-acetylglucosamine 2-epimerase (non-hydrolyzing) [Meiothermus sp.]|uniref:non-hydrolyzing UDP-N-acetylglucosamine 2-epimerase n=1 Tax=Meiothermus sp. TaxID=1955249 RepID=UPI0025D1FAC5|nr:UDP-N-acetylglucosamine 2-epimerase (non-hydrolyzing) [Meiothermus sp.]MCS7057521.1 UDP-N-acetylglucosamine 2-epimerase (non-hydrolyzing) [Meiothermus sp.]MCS7193710.1 UDP-N-acetylglucosamine 2-epimerase (non-hydrolyzing) [Meiothermus sp.]MCX7740554.1 UDP-N-acetylglucosamine 2-epimerase (non-hydrolyzing) [Meiothermus sp.]MDW8089935.1 UDP-N-acetylglucosamine 2-epimerase (non-hydrolyzing) [Meiothermus sp.]MDW8481640.1 UDP-N-acetylglucosamine 2-epimerase (non-hydrolyzing) [Meiothermus sp.]
MKRVVIAFGTRPEAIKMAPVIFAMRRWPSIHSILLSTGQHRTQLEDALRVFGLVPDTDLQVMTERQTLPDLMGRIVPAAASRLRELEADYVMVHGDTLTTFAVTLAAFFEGIPVAHVEAGLRSFNLKEPFPEEANRRLTDVLTDLDLPPTPTSKANLLREGKPEETIIVTGQTEVDAVLYASARGVPPPLPSDKRVVTVTMHRRENLPVMRDLALALARVAQAHPECHFVYPVHLNPAVREAVYPVLEGLANFSLLEPLDFGTMAALMKRSVLLVTDSGGVQESGATLGVPVVVLRNVTERPEGLAVGALKLAGTDPEQVFATVHGLLRDEEALAAMRNRPNPYGDGRAAERCAQGVAWRLGFCERPADWEGGPLV